MLRRAGASGRVRVKVAEETLSPGSINRTVGTLAAVMELAVEYGLIARNPAVGKRRRLPVAKPARPYLEPEQLRALLDAASEYDAEDRAGRRNRRPLIATLAFAGLRIGELLALRWTDIDLASGRIRVRASKTEAGVRTVDLQPELRDELLAWKLNTAHSESSDLVFCTSTGRADTRNNVRRRVILRSTERANARIATEGGCDPLPEGLSPHALRRTFASWLVAEGEDPAYVMQRLGHTDPKMTLRLYATALRSKRRRAHSGRPDRASTGTGGVTVGSDAVEVEAARGSETR